MTENIFDKLFVKPSKFSSTVPLGGTWNIQLHITDPRVNYIYLKKEGRNHSENRLIKLNKGESGNGTCYKPAPECHKYYSLRHIGENVIQITIRLLLKSMEGVYGLYNFCYWGNHNCTRDGAIKTFGLIIEGKVRWFTYFKIIHLLLEYPSGHLVHCLTLNVMQKLTIP